VNWLLGIKKQKETVQLMKYGVVCLELSVVCIIKGYVVMACGSKELGGGRLGLKLLLGSEIS